MQVTLNLSDDVIQQLNLMPDKDNFVNKCLKTALQNQKTMPEAPSKWSLLVKEIENNPALQLNGYSGQLQKDMQEIRETFIFSSDEKNL